METEIISDLRAFELLKEEWNRLLERSHTKTIFMTWEWVYTWWEVFGKGAELFIVAVRSSAGDLVGLAPLCIRRSRYYIVPIKEVVFIGMGLSDRQDFIINGSDGQIIDEILLRIQKSNNRWDIVNLEQILMDSPLANKQFAIDFTPEIEICSICRYLKIEGEWGEYFSTVDRKFRWDIRNKIKRLDKLGKWEFGLERDIKNSESLARFMENIEKRGRKANSSKAFFLTEENRDFLIKFINLIQDKNWLAFSTLRIQETFTAYLLGFIYDRSFYAYSTAYDESYRRYSPGKLVMNQTIHWFFEHKNIVDIFDFLRGDFVIKSKWTSEKKSHVRMVFFKDSILQKTARYLVFNVRPKIKYYVRKYWKERKPPLTATR